MAEYRGCVGSVLLPAAGCVLPWYYCIHGLGRMAAGLGMIVCLNNVRRSPKKVGHAPLGSYHSTDRASDFILDTCLLFLVISHIQMGKFFLKT